MATQLADSPQPQTHPPGGEQPGEATAAVVGGAPGETPPAAKGCAACGAPMAPGQDWCLYCGAGAPGSAMGGGWRPLATVLAAAVVLALGAAAAGYAALSKKSRHAPVVTTTVAQVTPTAATTTPVTPTTPANPIPGLTAKPPTIPTKAVTPPPASTTTATTPTTPATTPSSTTTTPGTPSTKEEPPPEALLLDTNAASTYNPYSYPATWFGDPSLAIDGDPTTGWSAQVNPATAPNLAEGLLIDLKSAQRLSFVKLVTSTPGVAVQVYGSAATAVPNSITDKTWVPLSKLVTVKKHNAKLALRNRRKSYRWVTLWLSKAPASALGTPEAPGKVVIDEIELLPAK